MAERAEDSMENEIVCGAEDRSLSPSLEELREKGMQKYINGDDAVPKRETEEIVPSLRQSNKAGIAVELEDGFAPPLDNASAFLAPLDQQEESASTQVVSEKGGLIDSKHAAKEAPINMELSLEESRQGETPVEIEQEPGRKASAEGQHELPSVEGQSIVSDRLESETGQQCLVQPDPANTGGSELDAEDNSNPGECNINKPQEQLVIDAPGTSFMKGEVNPEKSEEQRRDYSASEELDEHVDLETAKGNVSAKPPAAATVPDEVLLMKELSFSTPAMEALIEADDEELSHEQEGFGTVEDPGQHLQVKETQEDSATDIDGQDALEVISNQVEVDNNEQGRTENNAVGDDDSLKGAAESAKEVIVSSGQELGMDTSADEQDAKAALGNEPPLAFDQETETPPVNEAPSMESCVERELEIEEPLVIEQDASEQSLGTAASSSAVDMAADIDEKGGKALSLKVDEETTSATSDVVTTDSLEETNSENELGSQAVNGKQGSNTPYNKECDETFSNQLETEELLAGTSTNTQVEISADDTSHGVLETSVKSEVPNKNHLSVYVLENGDSLQWCSSKKNGGEVEVPYSGHSTAPVLESGKVIDDLTEEEAIITASAEKGNPKSEDGGSREVIELGNQAAKAKARDTNGVQSDMDATSTSDSMAPGNGFLIHSEGDFDEESKAKVYTNGTSNICIADKENAQAFCNERKLEASLFLVVPQQGDRASEHTGQEDMDRTNGRVTIARRTNWWGCCGMIDFLLRKDE